MNEQWPNERNAEKRENFADPSFKTVRNFLDLLDLFPEDLPNEFEDVVSWIVEQGGDLSELEQLAAPVADQFTPSIQDSHTLVMTLTCAAALAQTPSLRTWTKVKEFTYNSFQLEHWLSEAMMAYAEVFPSSCGSYAKLAKEVFAALENFSLQSKSVCTNEERTGAWDSWNRQSDGLGEIWWGLRGWHGFMNYNEELPVFQVFYKLEPDEYIRTISSSANPYLVSALLFVAGIGALSPRFSEWKRMIVAAPLAFEDDGKWNGSVLIPLLLVDAHNQLLQARSTPPNLDVTAGELEVIKREIIDTAELIVNTLAERQDASGLFSRWASWLMRQILGQSANEVSDVKSHAFADDALIDAIGNRLDNCALPPKAPDGVPLWEAWCYRCVLASFAHSGHIRVPDWESFAAEWNLSYEDWAGDKGHLLRNHASLIHTASGEIPGLVANFLAYPIAQSGCPVEAWIGLWEKAFTLREIVEFGDADAAEDEYRSRSEAGRLLLLLFSIGLAIFDQISARSSDINSPEARSLARMFKALTSATSEMREIDSTLNYDKWLAIVQHLAVRRLIWEPSSNNENVSMNIEVFRVEDTPTVSEILISANGDVIEMVAILQSLLLNISGTRLKAELDSASIDLSDIVRSIRRLNKCHPRKYPMDETQLKKLEALAGDAC